MGVAKWPRVEPASLRRENMDLGIRKETQAEERTRMAQPERIAVPAATAVPAVATRAATAGVPGFRRILTFPYGTGLALRYWWAIRVVFWVGG